MPSIPTKGTKRREGKTMEDTYYESAEGVEITRKRAEGECKKHGIPSCEVTEFLDTQAFPMEAQCLLDWLGY